MRRKTLQNLLIVLLILNGFFSYSQQYRNPTIYLNTEEVELRNLFLNTKNIDSVKVFKKTAKGEIYIYTKNKIINFLSLEDVLKKHTSLSSSGGKVLIRIDGKIIDDILDIRIDDSYFIYVEKRKLSETKYLANKFRKLVIIDISLETEEQKPKIILRGNNEILNPEMNDLLKK